MSDSGERPRLRLRISKSSGGGPASKKARTSTEENSGMSASKTEDNSNPGFHSPTELLKKLFESGTGEWKMISSDGLAYKFHQLILSEQVPHFRAIFTHGTVECEKKEIALPSDMEISGPAVEAFLRYVYYQGTVDMTASLGTTLSMIRMAHYYNIPKIVDAANQVIQGHLESLDWFSGENFGRLYREVCMWEDVHPYKAKLLESLVTVIKRLSKNEQQSEQILSITNGDQVLKELIVKLAQDPPPPPTPPPAPLSIPPSTSYSEVMSRYLASAPNLERHRLERIRLLMERDRARRGEQQ